MTMIIPPAMMPSVDRCAETKRPAIEAVEPSAMKTSEKPATNASAEIRIRGRRSGPSPDRSVTETPAM
jgi:hypothetical protein